MISNRLLTRFKRLRRVRRASEIRQCARRMRAKVPSRFRWEGLNESPGKGSCLTNSRGNACCTKLASREEGDAKLGRRQMQGTRM